MRARLATADPAANAADALFQRALDFVPEPSRRRPRRRLWCALGAAVLAVAVVVKACVRGEIWLAYVLPSTGRYYMTPLSYVVGRAGSGPPPTKPNVLLQTTVHS